MMTDKVNIRLMMIECEADAHIVCVCVPVLVEVHNLKDEFIQLQLSTLKVSPVLCCRFYIFCNTDCSSPLLFLSLS